MRRLLLISQIMLWPACLGDGGKWQGGLADIENEAQNCPVEPVENDCRKISAGSVVQAVDGSIYYIGGNGQRYLFPDKYVFDSWYPASQAVCPVALEQLENFPVGGNVVFRAGTYTLLIFTDEYGFATGLNARVQPVASIEILDRLYSPVWRQHRLEVPMEFWPDYEYVDRKITGEHYQPGQLVRDSASPQIYYVNSDQTWSLITPEAFIKNGFQEKFVVNAPAGMVFTLGRPIHCFQPELHDPAQLAGAAGL